ncbi:MAG: helicase-related protein [Patescibacteria group bacterium]|nr:helicase-related protein [Patescibacteria group bacterium]
MEIIHGKLKPKEKGKIMNDFLNKQFDILVSTSIIEVGVDISNASIMIIEGADRFGLSQLHQFRGRVGRGEYQSYCFLFTDSENERTKERLKIMEKHNDGFELAKMDLKLRGSGDLYGTAQKGFPQLKIASLFDYELMKLAQKEAIELVNKGELNKYPLLEKRIELWEEEVHGE